MTEESKQQNSELSEQLKLSTQENGVMRLEVEDLRKRLEIADLMLQQVQEDTHHSNLNSLLSSTGHRATPTADTHCVCLLYSSPVLQSV